MSDKQHRSSCALIRNLCSNYDRSTGGCLLLDHGEIVQCPQMITQSLVCRFFRDVLLEDRDGRALKAEIMERMLENSRSWVSRSPAEVT